MRVVSVVNQKGGAGKSTTVMNLAAVAAQNSRVLVVDVDPQRSVTMWAATAERDGNNSLRRTNYDTVFVDTPGSLENSDVLRTVVQNSDFVVMPSEPTALALLPLVNTYRSVVDPLKKDYRVILTQVDSRSLEDAVDARNMLESQGLKVCRAFVRSYKTHERAPISGSVVTNYDSSRIAQKASMDYKDVALELFTSWAKSEVN
jgi:chromosome partitioning protein